MANNFFTTYRSCQPASVRFSLCSIVLGFSLLMVNISCSQQQREYGAVKNYKEKYISGDSFSPGKYCSSLFGTHIVKIGTAEYIVYLDSNAHIVFNSLPGKQPRKFEMDASGIVPGQSWYAVSFSGEQLTVADVTRQRIKRYTGNKDGYALKSTYNFDKLFNFDPYSMDLDYNNSFVIHYPYLYMPYKIHDPSAYYFDTARYFIFRLNDEDSSYSIEKKILFSPKIYKKGVIRVANSVLNIINDTLFLYGFESFDSIYLYNPEKDKIITRSQFEKNSFYRKFKQSKTYDLAYSRWYDRTMESNVRILTTSHAHTLVIKQQRKKEIRDKSIYEYYFLDEQLKVTHHQVFTHTINPLFCFALEKGFLVFDQNLENAYYYEE